MNLSDDLTPPSDPASLLRALRRRRRVRLATRAGLAVIAAALAALGLWPRTPLRHPAVATATPHLAVPTTPAALLSAPPADPAPTVAAAPAPSPVTMTRDELLDSLKDQTYALIRWPDGREQLLLRR